MGLSWPASSLVTIDLACPNIPIAPQLESVPEVPFNVTPGAP